VLDIDIKKQKFFDDEQNEKKELMDRHRDTLQKCQASLDKVEATKSSIASLKKKLEEAETKHSLLEEDLMDLNTLEHKMFEVCNSESISGKGIIAYCYMKKADELKLK